MMDEVLTVTIVLLRSPTIVGLMLEGQVKCLGRTGGGEAGGGHWALLSIAGCPLAPAGSTVVVPRI